MKWFYETLTFWQIITFTFLFSLLLCSPLFFDATPIKENDMNGNVLQLLYLKQTLVEHKSFPFWNPYINQGIPFANDPLNSYLYAPSTLLFLLLPLNLAIKMTYFTCIFLSVLSMYILLRHLHITSWPSVLIGCMYASGGYLASRINAGHLEKILSYPLLPLFVFSVFLVIKKPNIFSIGVSSLTLSFILFTGDLYNTVYSIGILCISILYMVMKKKKTAFKLILVLILFCLFSAIKILPFLELFGYLGKTKEPYEGSQNIISIIYYLFLPIKPVFSNLNLQWLITTAFGWWEKISFIGPLPLFSFIVFVYIFKKIKSSFKTILILFLVLLLFISMPSTFPMSIIVQNFEVLHFFHVPSRVFAYLSVIFLIIMALTINYFMNKKNWRKIIPFLLTCNLLLIVIFFEGVILFKKFNEINKDYSAAFQSIKNDEIYYISQRLLFSQIPQHEALTNKQKLLQTNYGFQIENSPARNFTKYDFQNEPYLDIVPKYSILPRSLPTPTYGDYKKENMFKDVQIFKASKYTPYVSIDNGIINHAKIGNNKISIDTISEKKGSLVVLESYFPGWEAYIDNTSISLNKGKFLSVATLPGKHKYIFSFTPTAFYLGLFISLFSILIWVGLVIFKLKQRHKKFFHITHLFF